MSENPLSKVEPWDIVVEGYVTDTQPLFELWAKDSFKRINPKLTDNVIDIACGPGTVSLMLANRVNQIKALDFSPNMINHLNTQIKKRGINNLKTEIYDCQSLQEPDNHFDLAFSQFGLMFFPDRLEGFKEILRVLKPNGKAAIYSWAPMSESTAMQMMLGALYAGFPETKPQNNSETIAKGLNDINTFKDEMSASGFKEISIEPIRHDFPIENAESFWESMVRGSAPITMMKSILPKDEWTKKETVAKKFVYENLNGAKSLYSTAYLAIGRKEN